MGRTSLVFCLERRYVVRLPNIAAPVSRQPSDQIAAQNSDGVNPSGSCYDLTGLAREMCLAG
jgi:hypothetical protein